MLRQCSIAVGITAALLVGVGGNAEAQTSIRPLGPTGALTLEIMRPDMRDAGLTTGSGVLFAGGSMQLRSGAALLFEIPFAHATFDPSRQLDPFAVRHTSSAIGNPYLGVLLPVRVGTVELGARVPIASDNEAAGVLAIFSDIDRMEAFAPDLLALRAIGTYTAENGDGASLTLFGGPVAWIGTGKADRDTDVIMSYGAHGGYDLGAARLSAGATGRMIVTESGSFEERTMHQAVASASFGRGAVRPGVQLSVPLDKDRRDFGGWAAGAYLSILLRR